MFGTQDLPIFALAGFTLNVTPGPDTMYIIGRSIAQGRRAGIVSALGIGSGTLVHTSAAAFGLSAILTTSSAAFTVLKWVGAVYLVYLGVQMYRSGGRAAVDSAPAAAPAALRTIFRQALLTNVLNPKVALFFMAFLPQFVDPARTASPVPFLFLGGVFVCTGTIWCLCVAALAARASGAVRNRPRPLAAARRITGVLFVGLGIRLAAQQSR
jgi:RhtB (resistance to homoserine/threonine) family protein